MTKRLTRALAVTLLVVAPASGQFATEIDSERQDFQRRLLLAIDLSDGQRDSLRALRNRLQAELDVLRRQVEEGYLLARAGRSRYRESIQTYRTARDSVLTGEQLALIDRARLYQREQQLDTGEEEELESLVDAVEMTGDQRRRWLALLERLRDELRAQREDGEVPTHTDYLRLREQHRLVFGSILTAEQHLELERLNLKRERKRLELEQVELDLLMEYEDSQPDSMVDASAVR